MREANREAVILFSDLDGTFADPDVRTVMESAEAAITPYRTRVWGHGSPAQRRRPGVVSRLFGRLLPRR